jgi:DNA mismatch endonuclease, patch repair protein
LNREMDRITKEQRSKNMSRVRSRDTGPELRLRSALHRMGLRYTLQRKDLPGKPDIVMQSRHTVIFVHGCFWHQHKGCAKAALPKTRETFWRTKLQGNVERDRKVSEQLKQLGWKVIVVWECQMAHGMDQVVRSVMRCIGQKPALRESEVDLK